MKKKNWNGNSIRELIRKWSFEIDEALIPIMDDTISFYFCNTSLWRSFFQKVTNFCFFFCCDSKKWNRNEKKKKKIRKIVLIMIPWRYVISWGPQRHNFIARKLPPLHDILMGFFFCFCFPILLLLLFYLANNTNGKL